MLLTFLKTSIFKALYSIKSCQFFVCFGKRYENDLRVIFNQWPKLKLGFDVEPEFRILKVIYCTHSEEITVAGDVKTKLDDAKSKR